MPKITSEQFTAWADKLRDISAFGFAFCKNIYDLENYKKIQDVAIEMFAFITDVALEDFEKIRQAVISHPTPFSVCDAAIVNNDGKLLLIQRLDNEYWALPGGYANVGETPAEGAIREALEETGIQSEAVQLVGVYDSRRNNPKSQYQLYALVFLCKIIGNNNEDLGGFNREEVLAMNWFDKDNLPLIDPSHKTRIDHVFQAVNGDTVAFFDK